MGDWCSVEEQNGVLKKFRELVVAVNMLVPLKLGVKDLHCVILLSVVWVACTLAPVAERFRRP